jgi:ubiquinone/menaquinone biosynthesis C-methylase UbiE
MPGQPVTAAEANRIFYRDEALDYDRTEACLRDRRQQDRLLDALTRVVPGLDGSPRVLDVGGGSGNVGAALHRHGVTPVVVDVSREMTTIWRRKAARLGLAPEIHDMPIEEFLAADTRRWDLITFSSTLHHLDDYTAVLNAAAARLAPGGFVLTIFDPTQATAAMRLIRKLDFVAWLALRRPDRFIRLLGGVVRRAIGPRQVGEHVGRMAERHAYTGIDDYELVAAAGRSGLQVIIHERSCDARLAVVRFALRRLDWPSSFHLVLQRPGSADDVT